MTRRLVPFLLIIIFCFTTLCFAEEYTGWKAEVEKLLSKGEVSKAKEALIAAEQAGNTDADFYFLRAKVNTASGQFGPAMNDIDKALEMRPGFVEAMGHKGIILLNTGKANQGIEIISKALEIQKDGDLYYARGAAYTALGEFEKAKDDLNQALILNSDQPDYYIARGELSVRLQDFNQARKDFERAIEMAPGDPRPYLGRGGLYLLTGERVKARADLDKCISIDPYFPLGYLRRGKYWELEGDVRRSMEDYRKASDMMTESDEAWFERTMAEMAGAEFEAAEESARHFVKISTSRNRGHKLLGTVLAARGKREEAVKELSIAISEKDNDVESMYIRGSAYAHMQQYDKALADFDKAISIFPKYLEPYLAKAEVYLAKKQPEKALEIYSTLLQQDPNNIIALKRRQELYQAMGKFDESMADLKRIREIRSKVQGN